MKQKIKKKVNKGEVNKSGNGFAIQFEPENLFACYFYKFSDNAVQLITVKCFEL